MSTIRDDNDRIALQLSPLLKACFALLILLELIGPFVNNSYGPDGGFHLYWIEQFITLMRVESYSLVGSPMVFGDLAQRLFISILPLRIILHRSSIL